MNHSQKPSNKKRRWIIGGVILLLAICSMGAVIIVQRGKALQEQMTASTGDIVTAFIGDLSAGATASGQVTAQQDARLIPMTSGTVAQVYVSVGNLVQEGDPLLALETAELERAVASAQQSLLIQENNLAKLLDPASATDIAAAQASVASARASLESLRAGPTPEEIAAAEASVRAANADVAAAAARLNNQTAAPDADAVAAAELELELAQTAATQAAEQHSTILVTEPNEYLSADKLADIEYSLRTAAVQANARLAAAQEAVDQLQNGDAGSIASAQAGIASATAQRDLAQLQLDQLLAGATDAQIAAAESTLAQAEANLDALQRPPADAQVVAAEVAIEQARINVQRAQHNLERATLTAPFTGMVTAVYAHEGEIANGVVMELVDNNSLQVILSVDEVDLANLAVGQSAVITLETWPDTAIDGTISAIAPAASSDNNALVTYDVYVSLADTTLPVLVGMTANADLITDQKDGILLLPSAAINADRKAGTYSVNKVTRNADQTFTTTETSVTIGLRDGQYTQITSGVQAGDEVMVGSDLPVFRFGPENGDSSAGNGPFGGGQ